MLIPTPKWEESVYEAPTLVMGADTQRIKEYMNCKPWKCVCGLTNFGRNKNCADFRCKKPRPADFVEAAR